MSTNINVNQGGQSTTFSILRVNGKLDTGVNNIPVQLGYSKVTLGTDGQTFCAAIWHTGSSTMYSSINSINQTPFTYVQNAWEQTMTCDANNFYFSFTYTSDGINFYLYIYKNSNAFIYNSNNNYYVSNMKILDGGNLYTQ